MKMYTTKKSGFRQTLVLVLEMFIAMLILQTQVCAELPANSDFPIWIELQKPKLVTVRIENAQGDVVRNLVAEMQLPAGRNRLSWDGYDDGKLNAEGDLVRQRVAPGSYVARGLTHDGIKLFYEFTAYSGGNPPWPTQDKTGGWLADHSCPLGAVFLPAGSGSPYGNGAPQVLMTALIAEAGAPFVWVDLDGKTLQRRQMWGWDGAIAAARDAGKAADPDIYAYLVMGWSKKITIRGMKKDGSGTEVVSFEPNKAGVGEPRHEGHSLAVYDGLLVFNAVTDDVLVFADVPTRKIIGTMPMPVVRGLQFDSAGRLLVISENKVLRFTVTRPPPGADGKPVLPELNERTVLIEKGLENPRTLAFNPAGDKLYVADWGKSNQVKVFTPEGKLLLTIGKPGGPQIGLYDELRMQNPLGLAIDDRNQLWVVEADHLPKRISLWNATTGKFIRAHYGPPKYGGGGTIDPIDKSRMFYADYYGLMEFKLDWKLGTAKPYAILIMRDGRDIVEEFGIEYGTAPDGGPSRWGFVSESPVHVNGRTYFTSSWQQNTGGVIWMLGDDYIAWPVARVGGGSFSWPPPLNENFSKIRPNTNGMQQLIAWSDLNGNHKVDSDEYSVRDMPATYTDETGALQQVGGIVKEIYHDDLSMTANWGLHVPKPTFDANGIPLYDLTKAEYLLPGHPMFFFNEWSMWGLTVLPLPDGWTVAGFNGWRDRKLRWSYPINYDNQPPRLGGEVIEPKRLLGQPIKAKNGEAGYWFAVNGEKGNIFLLTSDGMYLQTLGGDMRTTPLLRYPTAERGMLIDAPGKHISFEDEHYNPTITQTADGNIYLVAGKEHSSIFRVDGFDSVRRHDFYQLTIDAAALANLPEQYVIAARKQSSNSLQVETGASETVVDGKLGEYATWVPIGSSNDRQAAVRIAAGHLYAAWKTGDKDCLANSGGDYKFLFKRGGSVDLMIRTKFENGNAKEVRDGDIRLLITKVNGETKAVLYRGVVPGTAEKDRTLFESPVGSVFFDSVTDISKDVQLAQLGGDVEISVPLEVLGLKANAGQETLADFGILRGDGAQTIQRLYWNNINTLIVSDIPSEARLQPNNWGTWRFVAPVPLTVIPAVTPADVQAGLSYSYYKGNWNKVPKFVDLTPTAVGTVPIPQLNDAAKEREYYAIEYNGFIRIPADGVWNFTLATDDSGLLWIGDTLVIDNDSVRRGAQPGMIRLAAGLHPIRIGYLQTWGGSTLVLSWSGPEIKDQTIPAEYFVHSP